MPDYLRVTVRFLQPFSHGRGERGDPEWPPSPLRLFQAIVAAAAARWNERATIHHAAPILRLAESLPPPTIVAPAPIGRGSKYRLYVPDNVADKVGAAWSRGLEASIADYRTEKDVRSLTLPEGETTLHYLWEVQSPEVHENWSDFIEAARSITHLGWGIDMVAGDASVVSEAEVHQLRGDRWLPTEQETAFRLRVPTKGTLAALTAKYAAFLGRIGSEGLFRPVPPLTCFRLVGYSRSIDPPQRSFVAFRLRDYKINRFRPFDSVRNVTEVAAMLRHVTADPKVARAVGWSPETVAGFVLGHGEPIGKTPSPVRGPRLAFIPVPTIGPRGQSGLIVGSINRVLITVFGGSSSEELTLLARLLAGSGLIREGGMQPVALLDHIKTSDNVLKHYCGQPPAATWATVTPVILPGFDDPKQLRRRLGRASNRVSELSSEGSTQAILAKLDDRIDNLLRKAIRQAGYSVTLAQCAEIHWRSVGFWPGTDHASRYEPPKHLKHFRRLHVRLTWRNEQYRPIPISGPICFGGGRFYGFGLFAASPT